MNQIPTHHKSGPKFIDLLWLTHVVGKGMCFRVHLSLPCQGMHPVFHASSLKKLQPEGSYPPPAVPVLETVDWPVESAAAESEPFIN